MTYQRIPLPLLLQALDLSASELPSFAEKRGWRIEAETVVFPATEDNQARPKKIAENIHFDQLGKILATGTPPRHAAAPDTRLL